MTPDTAPAHLRAMQDSLLFVAGQGVGLVALAFCVIAFASKNDDRLLVILIFGNLAFAIQFALFQSWVAAGIAALIILRIVLARRFVGNWWAMLAMLGATLAIGILGWSGLVDLLPMAAGIIGTIAMFMLRGIPMRVALAVGALCWVATNAVSGSVGALVAELLIFVTNIVTIRRIMRDAPLPAKA